MKSCVKHWVATTMMDMATQPNTQPVPTPALTLNTIRKVLNPRPSFDAPVGVWRDHGYLDAVLDAAFDSFGVDPDEVLDHRRFALYVMAVSDFDELGWACTEWLLSDLNEINALVQMTDPKVNRNGKSIKAKAVAS